MRILSFLDTDQLTAPARFALDLAVQSRDAGHEVILAGLVKSKGPPARVPLGDAADAAGVPFRLIRQRMRFDPGILGQMEMIYRRMKPDLFQSHDLKGMALYRMARRRPGVWQAFVHETAAPASTNGGSRPATSPGDSRLLRYLERDSFKRAHQVITLSPGRAEELAARGVARERLIVLQTEGLGPSYWAKSILAAAEQLNRP